MKNGLVDPNTISVWYLHVINKFIFLWKFVKEKIGISIVGQLTESVESSFLIHQDVYHDSIVCPG